MTSGAFPSFMDCYDFMQQVDTFIDGELEIDEHSAMEAHSSVCADCNEKEARRRNTRQRLRATTANLQPSTDFMARLHAAIEEKSTSASVALREQRRQDDNATRTDTAPHTTAELTPVAQTTLPPVVIIHPRNVLQKHWKILAVAAAALCALTFNVRTLQPKQAEEHAMVAGSASFASPVIGESVAWHRRSVPVEVVGPDPNTVRRWFADKVSFAVNVPQFSGSARLLGGRLSHVRQYEAAYLLYEVNGTKLSVMLFDAGDISNYADFKNKTFVDNSNGYNVAIREKSGVTYTFTSDMEAEDLAKLVDSSMAPAP